MRCELIEEKQEDLETTVPPKLLSARPTILPAPHKHEWVVQFYLQTRISKKGLLTVSPPPHNIRSVTLIGVSFQRLYLKLPVDSDAIRVCDIRNNSKKGHMDYKHQRV